MAVLFYQIGIFIAIQIAALYGKNSRNTAIILITIFTFLQVSMSWLLTLQLITIYISYNFSKRKFQEKETNQKQTNNIRNEVRHSFENDPDVRNAIEPILNDYSKPSKVINPIETKPISLKTRFYYIDHSKTYGPVTVEKLISLVKSNQINKNCFVRQESEKGFEKRAYEIIELFY